MLTQDRLKELFSYNLDTGLFTRIKLSSSSSRVRVGVVAGCTYKDGYVYLKINSKHHKAHRLAFLYITGSFPKDEVDHINGIKSDNRFCNLREVTKNENLQNQKKAQISNKTTGLLGCWFERYSGKYVSRISINNKQKHLGRFDTKEEAHAAYIKAKRELHTTCTI